jgi:hypothetical protein
MSTTANLYSHVMLGETELDYAPLHAEPCDARDPVLAWVLTCATKKGGFAGCSEPRRAYRAYARAESARLSQAARTKNAA